MALINRKTNTESSNGSKTSASTLSGKTVEAKKLKTEKSMSEADKLTLRAWKKTFENHKKAA